MSPPQPAPLPSSLDDCSDELIEFWTCLNRIDRDLTRLLFDLDQPPDLNGIRRALRLLFERQVAQTRWQLHCHQETTRGQTLQERIDQRREQLLTMLGVKP